MKTQALNRLMNDLNKVDEAFMMNLYEDIVAQRRQAELMRSLEIQPALPGLDTPPKSPCKQHAHTTSGVAGSVKSLMEAV